MTASATEEPRRVWSRRERPPWGQLGPVPWLSWPETRAVVDALQAEGTAVRFVGGCVRDALLGVLPRDIDLATPDPPDTVIRLLEQAGLRCIPTGLKHGTVTARVGEHSFEITTLREDVETDGRHAVVQWSSCWMADAARRDFTINALSATPDGAVYDYFDGLDHLSHGWVAFVGRPMQRIAEDWLRILRFFRFYARFGRPPASANALSACQVLAPHLRELSAERIRDELTGILDTPGCADVLLLMRGARVLEYVLPEAGAFGRLRQLVFLETRGLVMDGIEPDPLRRLAAVLHTDPHTAIQVARRLRLSSAQVQRLFILSDTTPCPDPDGGEPTLLPALFRMGRKTVVDIMLLVWSSERDGEHRLCPRRSALWQRALDLALSLPVPSFPLKGRDLLANGYRSGPLLGRELARLQGEWLHSGCRLDRTALLSSLRPPSPDPEEG